MASAAPAPEPGTLLDTERVALPSEELERLEATVTRVTYSSRSGRDDSPVAVSGLVIEPVGQPPPGGWPVVSYAHGTTGVADACAPSGSPGMRGQLGVVLPLVERGYLVTATDYEGLGTPGAHPYLQPVSEGRSVIDAFYPLVLHSLQLRYPALDYSDYLSGRPLAAMDELERSCIPAAFGQAHVSDFVPSSPAALTRAQQWLEEFALPQRRAAGPLFVAAGTADDIVPVELVDEGVAAACELGDVVTYRRYSGAGHPALPAAADDALAWIADRFAGRPPPPTC
ncbi:MAG: hypothetical protein GEU83_09070 [Pseudonocardiaceae bacterium]|nr:hypothetical protein [Pseudonocardiaceae bacterium]